MFLLSLLACQDFEAAYQENVSFLDQVTNMWWNILPTDDNFYLEYTDDSLSGNFYMDYINGPEETLENNVYEGQWFYTSKNKFLIETEDEGDYSLKIKEDSENPECYSLTYKVIYKAIVCPLEW